MKKVFLSLLCLLGLLSVHAQQDLMLYGLPNVTQQLFVDPSAPTHGRTHIGLPLISGVSASHKNTVFNPARAFEEVEGQLVFQTDEFLSSLDDRNVIGAELSTELFSFGIPVKDHYFSFSWRDRIRTQVNLPADMLRFPFVGNGDFETTGNSLDFSDLYLELDHYSELAFGWQHSMDNGFDVGARVKILSGKENIRTTDNNLRWNTDLETYAWTFQGDASLQTSGIAYLLDSLDGNGFLEHGDIGGYYLGFRNLGLATDLGVGYHFSERWSARASIVDLGFISWSDDTRTIDATGGDLAFVGIELTEAFIGQDGSFQDSLDAAIEELGSSIEESLGIEESSSSYRTNLRSRIYASVAYRIFKSEKLEGRATLLAQAMTHNGLHVPTISAIYTQRVGNTLGVNISYSIMDDDFKNIGLGISVKGGPVLFYATVDNLLWTNFTKVQFGEDAEATEYPAFSQNASLRFGINLLVGKKDQKPMARLD